MPAEAEKPKNETGYIVLVQHENGATVTIVGDVQANGPEQAVARKAGSNAGVFVAVPVRNWTVVEQQEEPQPPKITQEVRKWQAPVEPKEDLDEQPATLTGDAAAARVPAVPEAEGVTTKIAKHPADTIDEEDGA